MLDPRAASTAARTASSSRPDAKPGRVDRDDAQPGVGVARVPGLEVGQRRRRSARQKSQNSTSTGRPRCLSMRSDATLTQVRPAGNGGAGMSTAGRTAADGTNRCAQVAAGGRVPPRRSGARRPGGRRGTATRAACGCSPPGTGPSSGGERDAEASAARRGRAGARAGRRRDRPGGQQQAGHEGLADQELGQEGQEGAASAPSRSRCRSRRIRAIRRSRRPRRSCTSTRTWSSTTRSSRPARRRRRRATRRRARGRRSARARPSARRASPCRPRT